MTATKNLTKTNLILTALASLIIASSAYAQSGTISPPDAWGNQTINNNNDGTRVIVTPPNAWGEQTITNPNDPTGGRIIVTPPDAGGSRHYEVLDPDGN